MDFSSAATASRLQRSVNSYLCIKPFHMILLNVFIDCATQPIALQGMATALSLQG